MSQPPPAGAAPSPDPEIVSSVLLDAPPERVFEAYADPVRLARWWGPKGFRNTFQAFDFVPGGRWRLTMHGPDGADYQNENQFVELVRPERIVFEHLSEPRFRMTITLTRRGGQTELLWRMRFEAVADAARLGLMIRSANEENFDRLGMELFSHP